MNMHADENSDGVIVPKKRPNKEGLPSAEAVGGRTPPKGNGGETAAARMTVGVYGLVAGIVKLDDASLFLSPHEGESGLVRAKRALGRGILRVAPWLMKFLSIAGTAAMFLVGGGILTHNVPALNFAIEVIAPYGALGMLADLVVGVLAGAVVLGVVKLIGKLRPKPAAAAAHKPSYSLKHWRTRELDGSASGSPHGANKPLAR